MVDAWVGGLICDYMGITPPFAADAVFPGSNTQPVVPLLFPVSLL